MTVPQRLSFSELLSNCNLATSWHIELSILGLLHLSISIHSRICFSCSMRFFQLKITLGLALGETWPLLAQPQKNTGVYQGLIAWEGFCRQTCKNYLRQKQGCELLNQIWTVQQFCASLGRSFCHGNEHQFRPIMTVSCSAQLTNRSFATSWHIELSILGLVHLSISIHLRISFINVV